MTQHHNGWCCGYGVCVGGGVCVCGGGGVWGVCEHGRHSVGIWCGVLCVDIVLKRGVTAWLTQPPPPLKINLFVSAIAESLVCNQCWLNGVRFGALHPQPLPCSPLISSYNTI